MCLTNREDSIDVRDVVEERVSAERNATHVRLFGLAALGVPGDDVAALAALRRAYVKNSENRDVADFFKKRYAEAFKAEQPQLPAQAADNDSFR